MGCIYDALKLYEETYSEFGLAKDKTRDIFYARLAFISLYDNVRAEVDKRIKLNKEKKDEDEDEDEDEGEEEEDEDEDEDEEEESESEDEYVKPKFSWNKNAYKFCYLHV